MKFLRLVVILILTMTFFASSNLYAADLMKLEKRIQNCNEIINEIIQVPDKAIPTDLLSKCAAHKLRPVQNPQFYLI